jgi:hypothetical protein
MSTPIRNERLPITGEIVAVKARGLASSNERGGTVYEINEHEERVRIMSRWHDYEIGWRFLGVAESAVADLPLAGGNGSIRKDVYFGEADLA